MLKNAAVLLLPLLLLAEEPVPAATRNALKIDRSSADSGVRFVPGARFERSVDLPISDDAPSLRLVPALVSEDRSTNLSVLKGDASKSGSVVRTMVSASKPLQARAQLAVLGSGRLDWEGARKGSRKDLVVGGSVLGMVAQRSFSANNLANTRNVVNKYISDAFDAGRAKVMYRMPPMILTYEETLRKPSKSEKLIYGIFNDLIPMADRFRKRPGFRIPEIKNFKGVINWTDARHVSVNRVVSIDPASADVPALRYRSPRDFELSHVGNRSIYLDSRLLDAKIFPRELLLGVMIADLFKLQAKFLADHDDIRYTPKLARKVNEAARDLAESFVPDLTKRLQAIVASLAGEDKKPQQDLSRVPAPLPASASSQSSDLPVIDDEFVGNTTSLRAERPR